MSNDLNRCDFIGRLGKDVEMRHAPSGAAIASLSIACSDSWADKATGEKKQITEWVNVTAFGKLAEICGQYLKKGQQVYISGKMRTEKYEKDGQTRYITKIIANEMQMLGGKPAAQTGGEATRQESRQEEINDDIPF